MSNSCVHQSTRKLVQRKFLHYTNMSNNHKRTLQSQLQNWAVIENFKNAPKCNWTFLRMQYNYCFNVANKLKVNFRTKFWQIVTSRFGPKFAQTFNCTLHFKNVGGTLKTKFTPNWLAMKNEKPKLYCFFNYCTILE